MVSIIEPWFQYKIIIHRVVYIKVIMQTAEAQAGDLDMLVVEPMMIKIGHGISSLMHQQFHRQLNQYTHRQWFQHHHHHIHHKTQLPS